MLNRIIRMPHRWTTVHAHLSLLGALLLCFFSGATYAAQVPMVSYLDGPQAGIATTAQGVARMVVDTDANTLSYTIQYGGLSSAETVAHFHGPAAPGVDASPVHTLPTTNPKVGVWNYLDGEEADILAGNYYINIHTGNFGGGEIRGQVVNMAAILNSAQSDAGSSSAATGSGHFVIDTDANTLDYYIEFTGLEGTETGAHIHGMALHTVPAGILHTLPAGSPKTGTWNYLESEEAAILAGQTYVNIHTTTVSGGEIRGQIVNLLTFVNGTQAGNASAAIGVAEFALDTSANQLSYHITYQGLDSGETISHIHGYADTDQDAPPLHTLPLGTPKVGIWDYDTSDPGLLSRTYVNIHSNDFTAGEIRGQIVPFQDITVPVELSNFSVE